MTALIILWKITATSLGEFFTGIPAAWVAVIGAAVGGTILKLVEKWLNASNERISEKKDYREEIRELQTRLDKVEADYEAMRNKYYEGQEQIMLLKAMLVGAGLDPNKMDPPRTL